MIKPMESQRTALAGSITSPLLGEGWWPESSRKLNPKDVVMTPTAVAHSIVNHFKPSGRVLDPCKGNGAFVDLMPGAEWCEISQGRDFFAWKTPVDWIVSNPPYSIFFDWLRHSFALADDIVYLIPLHKIFSGEKYMEAIFQFGGVKEIMYLGSARIANFPVGFSIGAVHFRRGYRGETKLWRLSSPNSVFNSRPSHQATP
jgi:hypothetical protein